METSGTSGDFTDSWQSSAIGTEAGHMLFGRVDGVAHPETASRLRISQVRFRGTINSNLIVSKKAITTNIPFNAIEDPVDFRESNTASTDCNDCNKPELFI